VSLIYCELQPNPTLDLQMTSIYIAGEKEVWIKAYLIFLYTSINIL